MKKIDIFLTFGILVLALVLMKGLNAFYFYKIIVSILILMLFLHTKLITFKLKINNTLSKILIYFDQFYSKIHNFLSLFIKPISIGVNINLDLIPFIILILLLTILIL